MCSMFKVLRQSLGFHGKSGCFSSECLLYNINSLRFFPQIIVPYRTTMIVKRRFPVDLYKEGNKPRMRRRTFFYDLLENTDLRKEPLMDVVLTSYVTGLGNPGDIVSLKKSVAYHKYILPGLAVYVTPESLEYSKSLKADIQVQTKQMSPSVEFCVNYLERGCYSITMNMETEWTIEPWHIRASLRKSGVHVLSESCIEMPPQPIKGPDMNLEGKDFYVTITVNKQHKVKVRCKVHHWSTSITDRLPFVREYWLLPSEQLFADGSLNESSSTGDHVPKDKDTESKK